MIRTLRQSHRNRLAERRLAFGLFKASEVRTTQPAYMARAKGHLRGQLFPLLGLVCAFFSMPSSLAEEYASALRFVPEEAVGLVRVPNVPELRKAWESTTLFALTQDSSMKPFMDFQRDRSAQDTKTLGFDLGIRPKDLLEIASGEAVLAWLPFDDPRRPFALVAVIDIRGQATQVKELLQRVDSELRTRGATIQDTAFGGQKISRYSLKPSPGQIKIDEIAVFHDEQRLIVADRESLVVSFLEAIQGKAARPKLLDTPDFIGVREQTQMHTVPSPDNGGADGTVGLEWFARPLHMGRVIKAAAKIDRGKQVDILSLLERQGFDAVAAIGGQITVGHGDFDLVHKGFVWAPPIAGAPDRFRLAARMLRPVNLPSSEIPDWVGSKIASFTRINWELSEAFWYAESLVDDAFGEPIFRDILNDIRDDQLGPQIDIAKDVIPNLGNRIMVLSDNRMPADMRSERMLVAVEVRDAKTLRKVVQKTMEVDPDATAVPTGIPGVDVYRVLRKEETGDFEAELFDPVDDKTGPEPPTPLLNEWAITVLDDPDASANPTMPGYLIFSSHPELLSETVTRFGTKKPDDSLGNDSAVMSIHKHLTRLASDHVSGDHAFIRYARTDLAMRAKYSLIREGRLRESDSVLATLFRRLFVSKGESAKELGTDRLPEFEKVQKFFRPAGSLSQATELGWTLDGFLIK